MVLQTLEVEAVLGNLSFSNDETFLKTNRGPLHSKILSDYTAISQPDLPRSISVKQQWVSWGMEYILWLPPEYRPTFVAVHGAIIAFGYKSGLVSFMEIAF